MSEGALETSEPQPSIQLKPSRPATDAVQVRISKKAIWALIVLFVVALLAVAVWQLKLYQPALDHYNRATVTVKIKEGDKFELEGATLVLNGTAYTSDAHGKVSLPNLKKGSYAVTITKDGYAPSKASLSLNRGDNDLKIFALSKLPDQLYAVKGFVQDYISGKALANVQVTLGSKTVSTDPSGAYAFEAQAPGDIKLTLSKDGYADKALSLKVDKEDVVTAKVLLVPSGRTIFVSNRDGKRELYSSAYDGSDQQQFVTPENGGEAFAPVVSTNNQRIAYSSTQDKVKDTYGNDLAKLYVVGSDGKTAKKVSDDLAATFTPVWSADGKRLYYSAYSDTQQTQQTFQVYDAEKGTLLSIGERADNAVFSPDGTTVAYSTPYTATAADATHTYANQVKTFNVVTGERFILAQPLQFVSAVRFSDDGKSVSYEVIIDNVRRRFQDAIGAVPNEKEIPVIAYSSRQLALSPSGTKQAFVEERDGKKDLYVTDRDGSNEKRLTTMGVLDDRIIPQWDAGSTYLTFAVKREGENALYVVAAGGGDALKITDFYAN